MIKNVLIRGKQVPLFKKDHISNDILTKVETSRKFQQYLNSFKDQGDELEIKKILILDVYLFGQNNIGFVNLEVEAYLNGKRLPGYVFLRGEAVGVLLLINDLMVLTKQFRIPAGQYCIEAPAGMLDESENFAGVAAKELKEECGIDITLKEMKYLSDIKVSAGGSDEIIHLFAVKKQMPQEELESLVKKVHGNPHEGEQIQLMLEEFNWSNILKTKDTKLICAAAYYFEQLKQQQK